MLTLTDVEVRPPGPGEIAVRLESIGVNPVDWKLRSGLRATSPLDTPRRLGNDGAGSITDVGEGVDGFRIGDPVVLFGASGLYATDVVVSTTTARHRPSRVTAAQGAALGIPVSTAYQTLRSLDAGSDDTLLVHAGSGSVGQAVVQFAVLFGAKVVATSSPRRFGRLRALGAKPIAYGDGLTDRVRAAAPSGVTVAIDIAGTDEAIDTSLELVADRNRIVTLVRGGEAAGFGIRAFGAGSPVPIGAQQRAWRAEAIPVALALLAAGRFSVELGAQFALREAAEAHRVGQAGADGKLILTT